MSNDQKNSTTERAIKCELFSPIVKPSFVYLTLLPRCHVFLLRKDNLLAIEQGDGRVIN